MLLSNVKTGMALAIFTYSVWGLFPLYFKLLVGVSADEVVVHRIVWSGAFTFILLLLLKRWRKIELAAKQPGTIVKLTLSAFLLAANWLIFIYATLADDVLQLSLGYFINPLFNMLFGVLLFKERATCYGKIAIGLALIGLAMQLIQIDKFPFLAVAVALIFSLYGVVRKGIDIDPIMGLFIETLLLLPFGLIYLIFFTPANSIALMADNYYWLLILTLVGPVTSIPLITFSAAIKRIPYFWMGFCQYITPTLMFTLAVFVYKEHWSLRSMLTFGFVWAGILCVIAGSIWQRKKNKL